MPGQKSLNYFECYFYFRFHGVSEITAGYHKNGPWWCNKAPVLNNQETPFPGSENNMCQPEPGRVVPKGFLKSNEILWLLMPYMTSQ